MRSGISLRLDFLWGRAAAAGAADEGCRSGAPSVALASIYNGGSRSDAARLGSATLQIVRD